MAVYPLSPGSYVCAGYGKLEAVSVSLPFDCPVGAVIGDRRSATTPQTEDNNKDAKNIIKQILCSLHIVPPTICHYFLPI
jgi:hypothetical protein